MKKRSQKSRDPKHRVSSQNEEFPPHAPAPAARSARVRSRHGDSPARGKGRLEPLIWTLAIATVLGVTAGIVSIPDAEPRASAASVTGTIDDPPARPAAATADGVPDIAPSLGGLWIAVIVFGAIGLVAVYAIKGGIRFRPSSGVLHVVDTLPLGGRRLIHLVRCGDRKYLIGNSERGIQYLASIPCGPEERDVEERAAAYPDSEFDADAEPTFAAFLGRGGALR